MYIGGSPVNKSKYEFCHSRELRELEHERVMVSYVLRVIRCARPQSVRFVFAE